MSGKPNDKMFKTMVEKHGSEQAARAWFRSIGSRGGKATFESHGILKGFATMTPEQLKLVSAKGGKVSKRGK